MDITKIRQEFPILRDGKIVYLDSAATAQKPECVLDAMNRYYREENANVHRGMHILAEKATIAYEKARTSVARFLGAASHEIVFTKNCTEAINLVARTWGKANLHEGDTVVLSILEHHSNIVPWLQLKEDIGINVEWIDIDEEGLLQMGDLDRLLETGTVKLVSVTGLSNVLGTYTPMEIVTKKAHEAGALVHFDAAQRIVHDRVNVRSLDCDFLTFSGHKLYGPTGIGVLYGKRKLLEAMPPFLGGGMMIGKVECDRFTCADIPAKFEAGTPPIAEAVGLKAAIDRLTQYDHTEIKKHEDTIMHHAIDALQSIRGLQLLCQLPTANCQLPTGCISFVIDDVHPHDLTEIIGRKGVCLRAGHHCTQPLHERLGITASTRLSVGIYNTNEDIASASDAIEQALKRF